MADPLNPSFETAGAADGQAASWSEDQGSAGEDVGIFNNATDQPFDAFESAHNLPSGTGDNADSILEFEDTDLAAGTFDGNAWETFETDYQTPRGVGFINFNQHSILVFTDADLEAASFDTTPEDYEDFEEEFTDPYGDPASEGDQKAYTRYAGAPGSGPTTNRVVGTFDTVSENYEDFEEGYGASDDLVPSATSTAPFTGGSNNEDGFETWTSDVVW
jgi:hypothetical protein